MNKSAETSEGKDAGKIVKNFESSHERRSSEDMSFKSLKCNELYQQRIQ